MKISIITPTFNSETTISQNVNSILSQTYKNFEQIIIDNASSDKTVETIKNLYKNGSHFSAVKIVSEEDHGISEAFNKGLDIANGDIIAILNSDDYYLDNKIFEKVINVLKSESFLFTHGDIYFEDPLMGSVIKFPNGKSMINGMFYNHPTMFIKKSLFDKIGLFNCQFKLAMDFELLCRFEKQIPNFHNRGFYITDKPITCMQYGGKSWINPIKAIKETKTALKNQNLWSTFASYYYYKNLMKANLNKLALHLGLNSYWAKLRKLKWKISHP